MNKAGIGLTLRVGAFCVGNEVNTVLARCHSQRRLPSQRAAPVEKRGTKDAGQLHPRSLALVLVLLADIVGADKATAYRQCRPSKIYNSWECWTFF